MRFSTLAAVGALVAPAVAVNLAKRGLGNARVVNKCDYTVYLWSIEKTELGCPQDKMVTLKPGEDWSEQFRNTTQNVGVSVKISKSKWCGKPDDITQLEYHINDEPGYVNNFLDVSFVDCPNNSCPGRDKFYLKSGNEGSLFQTAGEDKAICPILKCSTAAQCAKMAYILPDDVQTKSCDCKANLDFIMCADSPDDDNDGGDYSPQPIVPKPAAPSSSAPLKVEQPVPVPTSIYVPKETPSHIEQYKAAEVTPAPEEPKAPNVKTVAEVVYVTKYEYVNAKRHAHGHSHPHAPKA